MESSVVNMSNLSDYHCFFNLTRNEDCAMSKTEHFKRDAIALIRILASCLSIGGSFSIILPALYRKSVRSSKVFPLFIISVADCLLSLSWVVGGIMWLGDISQRVWCFVPSLLTVILVCVTANLTLVYALFSYSTLKSKDFNRMLVNIEPDLKMIWQPWKLVSVYAISWIAPLLLFVTAFAILEGVQGVAQKAQKCTCWCIPYFGNILPFSFGNDDGTALYTSNIRNWVAFYGLTVGTNYLLVFVLLLFVYWKTMRWIRNLRRENERIQNFRPHYGAVDAVIMKGEVKARKRITYFLVTFIFTGLVNSILAYLFVAIEVIKLVEGPEVRTGQYDQLTALPLTLYVLQSLTLPLQGLLNALVYGWTKEDFVEVVTHCSRRVNSDSKRINEEDTESDLNLSADSILTPQLSSNNSPERRPPRSTATRRHRSGCW